MRKAVRNNHLFTITNLTHDHIAQSPYDRVKKISRQSRDWINQYADNYKKKPRLERAITRFQSRYQNALSADGCENVRGQLWVEAHDELTEGSAGWPTHKCQGLLARVRQEPR